MVNKIVFRSLKKNWKLFGSIFILFTMATLIISISDLSYNNLDRSTIAYRESSNREDFRVYYGQELSDDVEEAVAEIEEKYNIESENVYYNREERGELYVLNVFQYDENQKMNKLQIAKGEFPKNKGEIALTDAFLEANELKLGEEIEVNGEDYEIVGTVYAPEYSMAFDIQTTGISLGPDSKAFGAAYLNEEDFELSKEATHYYRMQFQDELTAEEQKEIREKIATDYTIEIPLFDSNGLPQVSATGEFLTKEINLFPFVNPSSLNMTLTAIDHEAPANKKMFNILGAIIMGLALALTVILMKTIFKSQRREIGILKAEGIRNKELKVKYLLYLFGALVLAQITGLIMATYISPILEQTFLDYYSLPVIRSFDSVYGPLITKLVVVLIVVMFAVYFFAISPQLKQKVLVLVKNIDSEKPPRLNISKFTKRLSFARKYQINILIRNFSKTLLLSFGVMVSSFLLLQGSLILNGINDITEVFNDGTYTYDYIAIYPEYRPEETVDTYLLVSTNATNTDETSVELEGFNPDTEMMNLRTISGQEVEREKYNDAVISDYLAQKMELEIGDKLEVINPYQQDETIEFKVSEIVSDPMNARVYIEVDRLQEILDVEDDFVNAEMGVGKSKEDLQEFDENVNYIKYSDIAEKIEEQMSIVYTMVAIIAVIAAVVAVVTLITITIIIINNNRKTISVMKVLGYTNREIKKIITAPYRIILITIYFGSIPLIQQLINMLIESAFADADFQINVMIDLKFAMLGFLVIYGIYEFSMYFAYRVIKKIKLSESLKTDE